MLDCWKRKRWKDQEGNFILILCIYKFCPCSSKSHLTTQPWACTVSFDAVILQIVKSFQASTWGNQYFTTRSFTQTKYLCQVGAKNKLNFKFPFLSSRVRTTGSAKDLHFVDWHTVRETKQHFLVCESVYLLGCGGSFLDPMHFLNMNQE